jgi:glucuronoarabinoxylan endo-1,4-beta-xylanase
MKQNISIKIRFIVICILFGCFGSCSEENEVNEQKPYAVFLQETLIVSPTELESTIIIEWSGTSWEIVMDNDNGIIAHISQITGGNTEGQKEYTQVKLQYNENKTEKARTQELFLVNKKTGERARLIITQDSIYTPLSITLYKSFRYQYVYGFGGMYNPIIWTGSNLITDTEMSKMFAPDQLGYTILRLMVYPNEADWAADIEGAKRAQQYGAIIIASPWDCTDAFAEKITVNGRECKHLKHEHYQDYANHLVKYINYMKSNGVNLYAISVQNEPDMEFTHWYPQEVVNFVKEYGDQIRETGVKLMAPEACGMQPEYTDPILNDPEAFEKTDIIAGHLYQGFVKTDESSYVKNRYDYIVGLYNKKLAAAGKTWWMTEHLFNDGEKETDPDLWQFQKWSYNMETLAQEIHMCMEGYCGAYVYWYLKRFYGMLGDNDPRSAVASGEVTKNGYILSHYAKYASGMTRIKVETDNPDVKITAYINDAGDEITLVLLNMTNKQFNIRIPKADIKEVNIVETTEEKNMENVTAGQLESEDGVYFLLSGLSIASARINF